jgi:hypothetical protein
LLRGEAVTVLRMVSGGRQEEGRARGCIRVVRGRVGVEMAEKRVATVAVPFKGGGGKAATGGPLGKGREAGEQSTVGGRGGERRGRAWAGRERKMEWAEPG